MDKPGMKNAVNRGTLKMHFSVYHVMFLSSNE